VHNLHEYIYASDLVVSLAGRSTIDESLVYGTPGIFIPIKDHFEQEQNARKLGYSYEDISRLETLMRETIETKRHCNTRLEGGARNAAKIIMKVI
jgi:UDP-N-acetylglucosamine--N-acetylmuramyl-(pentapeptide) pyrophosphoryl-undecaprenol N-acetylglucosamine transferase